MKKEGFLARNRISAAQLEELARTFGPQDFCWLAGVQKCLLVRVQDLGEVEYASWPEGRLFSLTQELRWRAESDGACSAVLITDQESAIPAFLGPPARLALAQDSGTSAALYLWGSRTDEGQWRETRIPFPQSYPSCRSQARVRWVRYVSPEHGVWVRLLEVL